MLSKAGKCTLAARIDSFHQSRSGELGAKLRTEVEHRIEKLQEPPPVKQIKPLAPPIEQARKKRGGRRARKMKERLGITEIRKQANRMTFGEIEEDAYQDDLSFSRYVRAVNKAVRLTAQCFYSVSLLLFQAASTARAAVDGSERLKSTPRPA